MQQVAPEKDVNAVENESEESAKATQNESVENTANEVVEVQSQEENNTENVQKNDENYAKNGVKYFELKGVRGADVKTFAKIEYFVFAVDGDTVTYGLKKIFE